MGCLGFLKRIGIFVLGWMLFFPINAIILHVFGMYAAGAVEFVFGGLGILYILFGGIFDDNDDPPNLDEVQRQYSQMRALDAWQNQMMRKYK